VCVTVNYNLCKSARALCVLYASVIKRECVTQVLINPIIETRTRPNSGVYPPTLHLIVMCFSHQDVGLDCWIGFIVSSLVVTTSTITSYTFKITILTLYI
jgi:hypothetical protein